MLYLNCFVANKFLNTWLQTQIWPLGTEVKTGSCVVSPKNTDETQKQNTPVASQKVMQG